MAEYIEREEALNLISDIFFATDPNGEEQCGVIKCSKAIRNAPAADVAEVVHGEWTNIRDYGDYCLGHCSVCWTPQGATFPTALKEGFRYCRWCGAKMDGERRSDDG